MSVLSGLVESSGYKNSRMKELLATERRYRALVEHGWGVHRFLQCWVVYDGTTALKDMTKYATPEEAIDAALLKLEGK